MKLDDIFTEWSKDSVIDPSNLDTAALNIPILHSKWIRILVYEKKTLRQFEKALMLLRRVKKDWINGELTKEELKEYNLEPFQRKIMKANVDEFIESDKDIREAITTIANQKDKIAAVEDIVKNINNRGFQINSAINWKKFTHGYDG